MLDEHALRDVLRSRWGLRDVHRFEPQLEAMNSLVWLVEYGENHRVVVKVVRQASQLESGLAVAEEVRRRGMATPAACRTVDGDITVSVGDWHVAVMSYLPGRPLDAASSRDAAICGTTLGRLHHILLRVPASARADRWPWAWPAADDDHLRSRPEVRTAVAGAVAEARRVVDRSTLTSGTLHTDPGPTSFRVGEAGQVGIIDWGQAVRGPLLYDLASAVVLQRLAGPPDLAEVIVTHYRDTAPLPKAEFGLLDVFVRLRWAVQAWWFAARIATDDRLGLREPHGNQDGLATAMSALDASA